jgi:hypothetical protein
VTRPVLALLALGACRAKPPEKPGPASVSDADADTDNDTDADTIPLVETADTGDTAIGPGTWTTEPPAVCPVESGPYRRLVGTADADTLAWATYAAGPNGGNFGKSAAVVPDVSGDGLPDLAVYSDGDVGLDHGAAYLFASPLTPGLNADPSAAGTMFRQGSSAIDDYWFVAGPFSGIAGLSDLTGDGIGELMFTSFAGPECCSARGVVWVFAGPLGTPGAQVDVFEDAWAAYEGYEALDLGYDAAVGDLDGDGFEDLWASSPATSDPSYNVVTGRSYVFLGPLLPGRHTDADAHYTISGGFDPLLNVGVPIAMGESLVAADLTADGVPDLAVASGNSDVNAAFDLYGRVYLWQGPIATDLFASAADATLVGEAYEGRLGTFSNALGDTDGDGYGEIGMTAMPSGDIGAWVMNGLPLGEQLISDAARTFLQSPLPTDAASGIQSAGDLDLDGLDDITVGASILQGDARGAVIVDYGPLPEGTIPVDQCADAFLWWGGLGNSPYGAGAGDLDGDGAPDLVAAGNLTNILYVIQGGLL